MSQEPNTGSILAEIKANLVALTDGLERHERSLEKTMEQLIGLTGVKAQLDRATEDIKSLQRESFLKEGEKIGTERLAKTLYALISLIGFSSIITLIGLFK